MTPAPARRFIQHIGAMSSNRVILSELLSSRAHFRFPGLTQAQPSTPVRQQNPSERHTGTSHSVSPKGVTPSCQGRKLWISSLKCSIQAR